MIVVSETHKAKMKEILTEYNNAKFDAVLRRATPILRNYYNVQPNKLGKRLLDSLLKSWLTKTNEAFVQYWTVCKLVFEYNYPTEQIDLEVSCGEIGRRSLVAKTGDAKCDIVVYSHESRRPGTALIAIECREFGGPDGARQAASYSRALQSKYHLFTDSGRWEAFETQPHPVDGNLINDIPWWIGSEPVALRLSKKHLLPPITDEKQLRDLVKICHDSIHGEGIDPAKAFDELVKLFFVKVYDEQEVPDVYKFSVLEGENAGDTAMHIRGMLKKAKETSKYRELFSEPGDDEFWISNRSIQKVVRTFQGFSFTGRTLIGIDAKGTVYENMVGSTFRGELGQYFTPRKIVEFMVSFPEPTREDIILDPACGSGGFLIYVLRTVANQVRIQQRNLPQHISERVIDRFANNNIFGCDLSPRMVRAARMNMIMHGDGWSGIQRCHGLRIQEHSVLGDMVGKVTLILSNPPFAGYETDSAILSGFETGKNKIGNVRSVNRAIIFVEQIIKVLAEGGRAGLVLPRSIFENESYSFRRLRQLIYDQCEILGIIGLPRTAFHHTDCGILGDLLFFKKTSKPRDDYDVFVDWAEQVGYNTLGHNIEENDFDRILESYRQGDSERFISIRRLKNADNINPWYYHPKARELRTRVRNQSDLVPLTTLASVYNNRISVKALREAPDLRLRYIEVRDFHPQTGEFSFKEHTISTLPSRATYEMNGEEVIFLPNARNSLESGRKVIKVGEEVRGFILTNRFIPLRPKVNPEYLVMILNTDFVRNQLIAACKGAGSPDLRESKLGEIMIPVPDSEDLSSIDSFMENIADKIAHRDKLIDDLDKVNSDIDSSVKSLYGGQSLQEDRQGKAGEQPDLLKQA